MFLPPNLSKVDPGGNNFKSNMTSMGRRFQDAVPMFARYSQDLASL